MIRKIVNNLGKYPPRSFNSLKYSFGKRPEKSRSKNYSSSKKYNRQSKKLEPESFDNFQRRTIPKKPQFLLDDQSKQLDNDKTNAPMLEEIQQEETIEYRFDEELGMIVPIQRTDPSVPLKNLENERQVSIEQKQFEDAKLELQRQDKGKSLVKSMGRTIQLEAPKVKLTKYLSGASVMSTRAAKKLVKAGHILVNKKRVYENVKVSDYDKVEIWSKDGTKYVGKEDARLWIFYKPRGLVCTDFDPERRLTVMDYLRESGQILGTPKQLKSLNPKLKKNNKFDYEEIKREDAGEHRNIDVIEHVISVGRLDFNSEGLLLLTNDGDLARALELPSNKVERVSLIQKLFLTFFQEYRVRVYGRMNDEKLEKIREGSIINGEQYGPFIAHVDKYQTRNTWLNIKMNQGKNREIRKIMQKNQLRVNRLQRKRYGPYTLMGVSHPLID